jgi:hypothetical protein
LSPWAILSISGVLASCCLYTPSTCILPHTLITSVQSAASVVERNGMKGDILNGIRKVRSVEGAYPAITPLPSWPLLAFLPAVS